MGAIDPVSNVQAVVVLAETDAQLVVSDNSGNVVLRTDVGSFPYTWDGSDNNGNRLAEGAYNATAIIDGKSLRQKKIVVVKQ